MLAFQEPLFQRELHECCQYERGSVQFRKAVMPLVRRQRATRVTSNAGWGVPCVDSYLTTCALKNSELHRLQRRLSFSFSLSTGSKNSED